MTKTCINFYILENFFNETAEIPEEYFLFQNYPNPFNPVTTIKYQTPNRSNVLLKVYDIIGNEVAELVNEVQEAGFYDIDFNVPLDTEIKIGYDWLDLEVVE